VSTYRDLRNRPGLFWTVTVGLVLVVGGLAFAVALVFNTVRDQGDAIQQLLQERDAAGGALDVANDKLVEAGEDPVPVPSATATAVPGVAGATGPQGPQGPAPSDAQVRDAVTTVLQRNPSLTTSQVAAQVAIYLRANPPADGANGQNATDAQIATAVSRYLAANPPRAGAAGPAGPAGQDAPAVTPEQLQAAAAAALAVNPPPAGPAGTNGSNGADGAPGVGIATLVRDPDTCELVVTLTDGTVLNLGVICGPPGPAGPEGPAGPPGEVVTIPEPSRPADPDTPTGEPTTTPPITEEAQ